MDTKRQFALAQDIFFDSTTFPAQTSRQDNLLSLNEFSTLAPCQCGSKKTFFFFPVRDLAEILKSLALKSAPKSKRVASNCSFPAKGTRISTSTQPPGTGASRRASSVHWCWPQLRAQYDRHEQRAQGQPAVSDAPKSASGGLQLHRAEKGTHISL